MRDRETNILHNDVHRLILKCKVQRIVWLTDGDCRDITGKEIQDGSDLYSRPNLFFNTVRTFYDLLSGYDHLSLYFAHINSENLEGNPKGLDDLLCAFPDDIKHIQNELTTFKKDNGVYSIKFNVTTGVGRVHRYFMLHDVDTFYLHHVEKRKDLKGKDFKFHGTLYSYDETTQKCVVKIPSSASDYFRVGDKYYQYVSIPNRYGELEKQYHPRQKETIKEDNSKDIFRHIAKYQAFCTVPDHTNYQRVINNCFNCYFPFEHEMEEGECDITLSFIKHIFGEDEIKIDEKTTVKRYELGLDYITLLYKKPQQILPILSLVSSERQTGKTTFTKWLSMIFTENMAMVGNDDLGAQFNAHWSSKLIIACDETKIDKHVVMEKIKSLSTASKIMMNQKGIDQRSMEFFGKFILCSNNEDNFASIDKEEIRFWVIKVPHIPTRNVNLLDDLLEEIPAFIHFINKRSMVTQHKERHWFETRLLKTAALDKVVANSRPTAEKLIRHAITELFENSELEVITLPLSAIAGDILKKPGDKDYAKRVLHEMGYRTQDPQCRTYPRLTEGTAQGGGIEIKVIPIGFKGRFYEFFKQDFIKE
jgi:predicted house-cleaning NTP pyrophosphatase (Maf/HAM1 superfamily)